MKNNSNGYLSNFFKKMVSFFQKNLFFRNLKVIMYYLDKILLIFIKKPKYVSSKKKKILIIYNMAFGDGVIFRCSAINLRKVYPKKDYEVTLLCQKGINMLYKYDNVYDKIIPVDFNKSTVNAIERFKNFKIVRKNYYDIIIDPVGIFEWTTNIFYTRVAVGKEKIGLRDINVNLYCNKNKINKIYSKIVEIKKPNLSLIDYYNYFLNELSNNKLNFHPKLEKLAIQKSDIVLPNNFFVIFPSASMPLKRWPIDRYAIIAEKIYKKTKSKLVLIGSDADLEAINEFKKHLTIPYIDMVCKTNLNDYMYTISKAQLVVTNDTSAYHIAVVEEVPVALISGAYTYERYALYEFEGYEKYKKPCVIVKNKKCKNCSNRCPYLKNDDKTWPCLNEITIDYAWERIEKLIDENLGGKR